MSRILLALAALALVPACGDDGALPDAGYNCAVEDRDDEYTAGMEKVGEGGMTFRLVSSDPAPPSRYDNTWVIEIEDAGGAPLVGAEVEVTPYMPDHGHGTGIEAVVTPDPDLDGRYQAVPVNLFMPGLWQVTIQATPAGGTAVDRDEAVFTFCIAS